MLAYQISGVSVTAKLYFGTSSIGSVLLIMSVLFLFISSCDRKPRVKQKTNDFLKNAAVLASGRSIPMKAIFCVVA